ncbi:MAG: cation-transporting P-type ATPase, partial [Chloroflexota bacterium]|nr:cation-transporting P-type ATPase [Chloroflexota bacterium]
MNSMVTTSTEIRALPTAHEISQLPPDAVYAALATTPGGLTDDEVAGRLGQYGPNQFAPRPRLRRWLGPLAVAIRPLLLPLWIAAALAVVAGATETALVLAGAAVVNTVAGAVQERKAERATAALRDALPSYAHVVRDGHDSHILAAQVVPGDLLLLHSGELVPADARVVEEHDLRTVNVALMGEAAATRKVAAAVIGEDLLSTELPNLVYAGSRVVAGTAHAVVYATGAQSAYGAIAALTETAHEEPSPLLWVFARLGAVVMLLGAIAAAAGSLIAMNGAGANGHDMLLLAVGLLTAAVPVGLMPGITITLLEGWRRLVRRGALVRRLSSVETLGATTVICADKTGTLTQNEMTVREVWTIDGPLSVSGVGFKPEGSFAADGKMLDQAAVQRRAGALLRATVLTNAARLLPPDTLQPQWHILGDPVEAAAIVAATKAGYRASKLYETVPQVAMLPATDVLPVEGRVVEERSGFVAYLKGPAGALLPRCTAIATRDGERPLKDQDRHAIRHTIRRYDRAAMRTVAFACRRLPAGIAQDMPRTDEVAQDLVLLGLIAVLDPPRQEVEEAIRTCHRAGIRTMMLTGDYTLSAESIARRCALVERSRATVITGIELEAMDDATLRERLRVGDIVFARMTPEHKVRVVEALDAMGEVVLVTGGAANDVPAIKAADIGIAMGTSSSPAVREAADVILQDDNFATVATAIAEGRAVEQRARRLVALNLAGTVVKLTAFVAALLLGWPLLTVGQLLLIDLLGGFLPAVALGAGPPDPLLMQRRPRRSGRSLIDLRVYRLGYGWFGLLGALAAVGAALLMAAALGVPLNGADTPAPSPFTGRLPGAPYLQIIT